MWDDVWKFSIFGFFLFCLCSGIYIISRAVYWLFTHIQVV